MNYNVAMYGKCSLIKSCHIAVCIVGGNAVLIGGVILNFYRPYVHSGACSEPVLL